VAIQAALPGLRSRGDPGQDHSQLHHLDQLSLHPSHSLPGFPSRIVTPFRVDGLSLGIGPKKDERPETLSSPGRSGSPPPELLTHEIKTTAAFVPMALPCHAS
jgi:hypothetical protein